MPSDGYDDFEVDAALAALGADSVTLGTCFAASVVSMSTTQRVL